MVHIHIQSGTSRGEEPGEGEELQRVPVDEQRQQLLGLAEGAVRGEEGPHEVGVWREIRRKTFSTGP